LEESLGRPLSEAERAAINPFSDDGAVTGYFMTALRNAARDEVRREKAAIRKARRAAQEQKYIPPSPLEGIPREILGNAERLLVEELLPTFKRTNPRDWESLREIASGEAARDIAARELDEGFDEDELLCQRSALYQRWCRARKRLIKAVEAMPGDGEYHRETVVALRILIDEHYRRKSSVRYQDSNRPVERTGESR